MAAKKKSLKRKKTEKIPVEKVKETISKKSIWDDSSSQKRTFTIPLKYIGVFALAFVLSFISVMGMKSFKSESIQVPKISFLSISKPNISFKLPKKTITSSVQYADPWTVIENVTQGDGSYALIDIRTTEEYSDKHIQNSVNVPFRSESDREGFVEKIQSLNGDAPIVLMSYSYLSTNADEAFNMLSGEADRDVLILKAGWNELHNLPNIWIPEEYWHTYTFQDYIQGVE